MRPFEISRVELRKLSTDFTESIFTPFAAQVSQQALKLNEPKIEKLKALMRSEHIALNT
jgi:hypothetical protein